METITAMQKVMTKHVTLRLQTNTVCLTVKQPVEAQWWDHAGAVDTDLFKGTHLLMLVKNTIIPGIHKET